METTILVQAAQKGDAQALEALFQRYLPRVRQIVALRLGYTSDDFSTYEDVTQEALLNVFKNLKQYDQVPESRFRHWLSVCVSNSVKAHLRAGRAKKRKVLLVYPFHEESLLGRVLAGLDYDPVELATGEEAAERIEAALLSMPAKEREIIVLSRLCGMSPHELMQHLALRSEAAARKALSRALRSLKDRL